LSTLQLSQDYSGVIKSNNVDGVVLCEMKTRDDWKELGIFYLFILFLLIFNFLFQFHRSELIWRSYKIGKIQF